jgi:hypothetical protein
MTHPEIARARAKLGDFTDTEIALPDGSVVTVSDMLDDLQADCTAQEVIEVLAEVAQAGERH